VGPRAVLDAAKRKINNNGVAGLSNPAQTSVWVKLSGPHTHGFIKDHNCRKSLGTISLPGERQGTSSAIAGGDSMRTDGDRELNRLTTVGQPENNTADNTIAAVITTTAA
jgi:hypothetical protein